MDHDGRFTHLNSGNGLGNGSGVGDQEVLDSAAIFAVAGPKALVDNGMKGNR